MRRVMIALAAGAAMSAWGGVALAGAGGGVETVVVTGLGHAAKTTGPKKPSQKSAYVHDWVPFDGDQRHAAKTTDPGKPKPRSATYGDPRIIGVGVGAHFVKTAPQGGSGGGQAHKININPEWDHDLGNGQAVKAKSGDAAHTKTK